MNFRDFGANAHLSTFAVLTLCLFWGGCPFLMAEVSEPLPEPPYSLEGLGLDSPPYVVVSADGNHQFPTYEGCEGDAISADCDVYTVNSCGPDQWMEQDPSQANCPACYPIETAQTCAAARERFPSFLADLAQTGCQNACTTNEQCQAVEMIGKSGRVAVALHPAVDEEFAVIGAFFDQNHAEACSSEGVPDSGFGDYLATAYPSDGDSNEGLFEAALLPLLEARCEQQRCVLYPIDE